MRTGFTLIELMLASLVLLVGLAGAVSIAFLGMSWTEEIKVAAGAPVIVDMVMANPDCLEAQTDGSWRGWVNGYYVVRRLEDGLPVDGAPGRENLGGELFERVRVEVHRHDEVSEATRLFTLVELTMREGELP